MESKNIVSRWGIGKWTLRIEFESDLSERAIEFAFSLCSDITITQRVEKLMKIVPGTPYTLHFNSKENKVILWIAYQDEAVRVISHLLRLRNAENIINWVYKFGSRFQDEKDFFEREKDFKEILKDCPYLRGASLSKKEYLKILDLYRVRYVG